MRISAHEVWVIIASSSSQGSDYAEHPLNIARALAADIHKVRKQMKVQSKWVYCSYKIGAQNEGSGLERQNGKLCIYFCIRDIYQSK